MKKPSILLFSSALLLSSCGTYTGSGAIGRWIIWLYFRFCYWWNSWWPSWLWHWVQSLVWLVVLQWVLLSVIRLISKQEERIQQRRERIRHRQDVDYQRTKDMTGLRIKLMIPDWDNPNTNSGFDSTNSGDDEIIWFYRFWLYRFI